MPKRITLLITICYTLVLGFFSLATISSMPKLGTNYDDKIFHLGAYVVLVLLWYFTLYSLKTGRSLLIAAIASIIYGIIIEVLQAQLTTVRVFEILDILANCIGVTVGVLFIRLNKRTIVKNL